MKRRILLNSITDSRFIKHMLDYDYEGRQGWGGGGVKSRDVVVVVVKKNSSRKKRYWKRKLISVTTLLSLKYVRNFHLININRDLTCFRKRKKVFYRG